MSLRRGLRRLTDQQAILDLPDTSSVLRHLHRSLAHLVALHVAFERDDLVMRRHVDVARLDVAIGEVLRLNLRRGPRVGELVSRLRRHFTHLVRGLLRAVTLNAEIAPAVADAALDAGFIVNAPRPDVLRLAPPLVVSAEQLDTFVAALPGLLDGARP